MKNAPLPDGEAGPLEERDFELALAACLDEVERGQATPAQAVARYPQYPELAELVELAQAIRVVSLPRPASAPARTWPPSGYTLSRPVRAQGRRWRLITSLSTAPALRAAVVLVPLLLVWSALAPVTQAAMPGDPLYPLKRFQEQVALVTTLDEAGRAELRLALMGIRLQEAGSETLDGRTRSSLLADAAEEARLALESAQRLPEPAAARVQEAILKGGLEAARAEQRAAREPALSIVAAAPAEAAVQKPASARLQASQGPAPAEPTYTPQPTPRAAVLTEQSTPSAPEARPTPHDPQLEPELRAAPEPRGSVVAATAGTRPTPAAVVQAPAQPTATASVPDSDDEGVEDHGTAQATPSDSEPQPGQSEEDRRAERAGERPRHDNVRGGPDGNDQPRNHSGNDNPRDGNAQGQQPGDEKPKDGKASGEQPRDASKDPGKADQPKDPAKTDQAKDPGKADQPKDPAKADQAKDPPKGDQPKDPPKGEQAKDPGKGDQPKDPGKAEQAKDDKAAGDKSGAAKPADSGSGGKAQDVGAPQGQPKPAASPSGQGSPPQSNGEARGKA
ncbi:MAG: hypothetical protein HY690_10310 [Chloroflexi bacterium]|nr:hypothetical protein [Chloroflexota bacterium]